MADSSVRGMVGTDTGLPPATYAVGTHTGMTIDAASYRSALVVLHADNFTLGGSATVKIQESDDASSWSDVSGAAFSPLTVSIIFHIGQVNLNRTKQYVRVHLTVATQAVHVGVLLVTADQVHPADHVGSFVFDVNP